VGAGPGGVDNAPRNPHAGRKSENKADAIYEGGNFMPLAYWCVLIAALLPIALVVYAKAGSRDNNHPRDAVAALPADKRRAYAAHQNAYENFPFFAAAVIIATQNGASVSTVNILAAIYIVLRCVHGVLYITDAASARSLCFGAALLVNIAIFVLPAFK
jgi:uncharacterized MAPEG superfamily protein